eukprot:2543601-Pleurochrysis_carterae.AAC.1
MEAERGGALQLTARSAPTLVPDCWSAGYTTGDRGRPSYPVLLKSMRSKFTRQDLRSRRPLELESHHLKHIILTMISYIHPVTLEAGYSVLHYAPNSLVEKVSAASLKEVSPSHLKTITKWCRTLNKGMMNRSTLDLTLAHKEAFICLTGSSEDSRMYKIAQRWLFQMSFCRPCRPSKKKSASPPWSMGLRFLPSKQQQHWGCSLSEIQRSFPRSKLTILPPSVPLARVPAASSKSDFSSRIVE